MISVKLMVCASHIVRDADTNTLSIFNVFEGLAVQGFPFLIQQFAAAVVLRRDPATDAAEHNGRFEVRLGDLVLAATDLAVNFQDKRHTRQLLRINGLVIPAAGTLDVRFTMGALSSVYTVDIEALTPAQLQLLGGGG